ncbi:hypothetical protein VCHA51O444_10616 [Vibrio chagasii]|nr:hypothetical protein VCHA51O444_10616 [Vibrio chagasii]CAH7359692.1 hypothetical protein VCHA53O474_30422 [Vibrio chagasii]
MPEPIKEFITFIINTFNDEELTEPYGVVLFVCLKEVTLKFMKWNRTHACSANMLDTICILPHTLICIQSWIFPTL